MVLVSHDEQLIRNICTEVWMCRDQKVTILDQGIYGAFSGQKIIRDNTIEIYIIDAKIRLNFTINNKNRSIFTINTKNRSNLLIDLWRKLNRSRSVIYLIYLAIYIAITIASIAIYITFIAQLQLN